MPELPWGVAPVVLLDQRISQRDTTEQGACYIALFALAPLDKLCTADRVTGHRAAELTCATVDILIGLACQVCKIQTRAKHSFDRAIARIHPEASDLVRVQSPV